MELEHKESPNKNMIDLTDGENNKGIKDRKDSKDSNLKSPKKTTFFKKVIESLVDWETQFYQKLKNNVYFK